MRRLSEEFDVSMEILQALNDKGLHVTVTTNPIGYMKVVYNDMGANEHLIDTIQTVLTNVTGMRWSWYAKARTVDYLYPENSLIVEFRSLEHLVH